MFDFELPLWIDPTGEFLIAPILIGGAIGGAIEAASQLTDNGGNVQCLEWGKIGKEAAISAALGGALGNIGKFGKLGQRMGRFLQNVLKNTPLGPGGSLNRGPFRIGVGSHNGEQLIRIGFPGSRNHVDLINLGPK